MMNQAVTRFLFLALCAAILPTASTHAGENPVDVRVTRFDDAAGTCDGNNCTLRQAVAYLESLDLGRPGVIELVPGQYFLSLPDTGNGSDPDEGEIKVFSNLEIRAPFGGNPYEYGINAQGNSRHFRVFSGARLTLERVLLNMGLSPAGIDGGTGSNGSTLPGANADGGTGGPGRTGTNGGSIEVLADGQLFCTEVVFAQNQAGAGGDGGRGGNGATPFGLGGGSIGDGGRGGTGGAGGDGGAVYGGARSLLDFDACLFNNCSAGRGGRGGNGGSGGSGLVGSGSGGAGGFGAMGGSGGAIYHLGQLRMRECFVSVCAAGNGGDGGAGTNGASAGLGGNGGSGGRGGSGGNGGAVAFSSFDPEPRWEIDRSSFEDCSAGEGGDGGNAGSGGSLNAASGGNAGFPGRGGLLYAVNGNGTSTLQDSVLLRGRLRAAGEPGAGAGGGSDGGRADTSFGGGIYLSDTELDVTRCSITSCRAGDGLGGGIFATDAMLRMASCTLAENSASAGGFLSLNQTSTAYLNHCTVVNNTAPVLGAVQVDLANGSELHLRSTAILDNGTAGGGFAVTAWTSDGFNALDNAPPAGRLFTDFVGAADTATARVPALTPSIPYPAVFQMPADSLLVDRGAISPPAADPFLSSDTDILGMPRTIGGTPDIGSFENLDSLEIRFNGSELASLLGQRVLNLTFTANEPDLPVRLIGLSEPEGFEGIIAFPPPINDTTGFSRMVGTTGSFGLTGNESNDSVRVHLLFAQAQPPLLRFQFRAR